MTNSSIVKIDKSFLIILGCIIGGFFNSVLALAIFIGAGEVISIVNEIVKEE